MAKIGLQNFLFGELTEGSDGTPSYGVAHKPAKAISCNVSVTNNSAELYADDGLAESDTGYQRADVTLGLDDDNLEMMALLLGHDLTDGVMTRNSNDVAPYVGLGRIATKMVNNSLIYRVEFLKKVKFAEPNQEENTKGEEVDFGTYELEGVASTLANGDWSDVKEFSSMASAQTYLASLFEAESE